MEPSLTVIVARMPHGQGPTDSSRYWKAGNRFTGQLSKSSRMNGGNPQKFKNE